jgi:hypothetical protein
MDSDHPYQPPQAALDGPSAAVADEDGAIPRGVVDALIKTRPWVLFMGIMILLSCALMVMLALVMMLLGGIGGLGDMGAMGAMGGVAIGAFYLLLAALYLIPGIHLIRYSSAIKQMSSNPTGAGVEKALKHQLAFWRFVGIITVAIMGLYVVLILVAMVAGIAAA